MKDIIKIEFERPLTKRELRFAQMMAMVMYDAIRHDEVEDCCNFMNDLLTQRVIQKIKDNFHKKGA